MRNQFLAFFLFFFNAISFSQSTFDEMKGSVSYISSQNVYVKFVNTKGIQIGDTLFLSENDKYIPAFIVNNKSSISCIGNALNGINLSLTNILIARKKVVIPLEIAVEKSTESLSVNDIALSKKRENDSTTIYKAKFDGRFAISSYSNFSSNTLSRYTPNYRLRYYLALNAEHIANTGFTFENYMTFTHLLNNLDEKYKDLRVYNLSMKYDFDKTSSIVLGRKININTANIGAVDGLQFEKNFKNISAGALVGTRPNDTTYGFDSKLLQYGAFISHHTENKFGTAQTSLGFFNQMNNFITDRRYLYLQHSNSLLKNVDFFGSTEIDLYSIENNTPVTDFSLTSLYLSLNYRPVNNLSLSLSYDARKNVYYYETFKNRIDSTLEKETRQGLRFRFNYRPFKYFCWGGNAGYRLQTPTSDESMNVISYLTYSKLPLINTSLTLTGTALKTAGFSGFVYGGSMSKDFFDGNLYAEIEYRNAQIFAQNIAEVSLSWRLSKSLRLTGDFEATFEQSNLLSRVFLNLTQRF
ncbi:MAG: hypothetical protein PHS59_03680 [Paludibacter sp.]|nr:hypothetical protein [Paludibacter sp.]